jgi:hypothetical protein
VRCVVEIVPRIGMLKKSFIPHSYQMVMRTSLM